MTAVLRTTRRRLCARPGCDTRYDSFGTKCHWPDKYCSPKCHLLDTVKPPERTPRAPLVTRTTPKQRRTISPASPAQREKRHAQPSIVSGATTGLDPAHLALRGCDDPLCTVSLTRAEHRAFDDGRLDLLPYLLQAGCAAEIAHAVQHYDGRLPALLARLTGTRWQPAPESAC